MGNLDGLNFAGSVSDKQADTQGEKIDTTPNNDEERKDQERALAEVESDEPLGNDINADTSGDDSDDEESEEEELEDEESDDDEEEDEKSENSEKDDSTSKDEPDVKSDEEAVPEEDEQKKGIFESTNNASQEYNQKIQEIESNTSLEREVKDKEVLKIFVENNKGFFPESSQVNLQKFYNTGNTTFLDIDDNLYKFVNEVRKYRSDIPLLDRLTSASKIVFHDKIIKNEQKKGEINANIKAQKVNKAIARPIKTSSEKSEKSDLSPEQKSVMEKMGISEDAYRKNGNIKF